MCLNCIQGSWAWCQPEVTLRIQITSRVDQVDHLKQKVYGERKATPINRQVGFANGAGRTNSKMAVGVRCVLLVLSFVFLSSKQTFADEHRCLGAFDMYFVLDR